MGIFIVIYYLRVSLKKKIDGSSKNGKSECTYNWYKLLVSLI
jgi:hypothetical protein